MRSLVFVLPLACWLVLLSSAAAQTRSNPEISVVGDFRAFTHTDAQREDQREKLNLADPSAELFISGYLNPYVSAAATFAWHDGANAEIEEVYATVHRGLPLRAGAKIGRYRLGFGRLNPLHPHAYPFIHTPLPHAAFFGHEGLSDVAAQASFLVPTGSVFTEVSAGLLKGDALQAHAHEHGHQAAHEEAHEEPSEERREPGFLGRWTSSLAVSEPGELAFGLSALRAERAADEHLHDVDSTHAEHDPQHAWVLGADLKYKHTPSRYTSLQVELEGMVRSEEHPELDDDLVSHGAYGYVDYRFAQKYNVGGIVEWTRTEAAHEHEEDGARDDEHALEVERHTTWRTGVFVGWAPVEETTVLRLAAHHTDPEEQDSHWDVVLQLVIGLGPHNPHSF